MVRKCFRFGLNAGRNIFLFPELTEYEKTNTCFFIVFSRKTLYKKLVRIYNN